MTQTHDLRLVFWNVRDLGNDQFISDETSRLETIKDLIVDNDVDVMCLTEVADPAITTRLEDVLPKNYSVVLSDSPNRHHLAVIFKNAAAHNNITVTQRNEFTGPKNKERVYPLIEVEQGEHKLAILGMHAKAGVGSYNFKIRRERLQTVAGLAASLRSDQVPFIAFGDLNTLGNNSQITAQDEIIRTKRMLYGPSGDDGFANLPSGRLVLLEKDHPTSWLGVGEFAKYGQSNMDHVFVSQGFTDNIINVNDTGAKVHVGGWPEVTGDAARQKWVYDNSDHGYLMLDVKFGKPSP